MGQYIEEKCNKGFHITYMYNIIEINSLHAIAPYVHLYSY